MCQPFVPDMLIDAYPIHTKLVALLEIDIPDSYVLKGQLCRGEHHSRYKTHIVIRNCSGGDVSIIFDVNARTLLLKCKGLGALGNYILIRDLFAKEFGMYVEDSRVVISKWSQMF